MSQVKIFLYAFCALSGAIIGVGIFSLPYITLKVGVWTMVGYFVVFGGMSFFLNFIRSLYLEIATRSFVIQRGLYSGT